MSPLAGSPTVARRRAHRLLEGLLVRTVLAAVTCSLLPGCVVTTVPSFNDQADCPPSFVANEAIPSINKPVTINANDPTASFVATVPLHSCAVTKTYDARWFLDNEIHFTKVDPTGDAVRSTSIRVPFLNVAPGCHRIEFLATTAFLAGEDRTPQTQGDLADIVWFVDVTDGVGGSSSTLASCPP